MNKTVTINISGIIFHIEEDAFDKLSKYLSTIKGYFSKADGGNEIMSDIEARIAEMLQSKTSAVKQVVLMADVDYVMDSMGKPEEFAAEGQENTSSENTNEYVNDEPVKKRLYRDSDNKAIGGVCSGIAAYFDIDVVWIRIAMVALTFAFGMSLWVYFILWFAIPEAVTTAEKLAMKGERADINNISKAVKEEAEQLKKRMEKYGSDFKNMAASGSAPRNAVERFVDFLGDLFINIGRVLLKVIGVAMVIFGVIFFLGLFSSVFGMSFMTSNVEVQDWIDMVLLEGKDFYLGLIGIAIFLGTPIVMMIYGGVKILFKLRYSNRWVNLSAGILWLFGFALCLYVGIKTASDFSKEAKVREKLEVKPYDTLYLKLHELPINHAEISASTDDHDERDEDDEDYKVKRHHDDYMIGKHNNMKYLLGHAHLNIIKSQTDRIELVVAKVAKGSNKADATDRAKHIVYNYTQTDSLITFDDLFKVENADKFRVQELNVILKLPVNKVVYLDKSLENFIYDIENTTNTYDGEMVNRRWIMTEYGLKCVDCEGIFIDKNDEANLPVPPAPPVPVKVEDKNTKVTIDKNGVHIETDKKHK
jgi:phage shock protein PspC (stress-responsive transcriptional regulator)